MTTCKRCQTTKPLSDFYESNKTYCKECFKALQKERRMTYSEELRAYDRARNMRPDRVAARRAYSQSEHGRAVEAEIKRKWAARNQEKRAAHIILGNAVRDGRAAKPDACQRCAQPTESRRLHAHHDDYAKPLDVEWVCAKCHREEHAQGSDQLQKRR